MGKGVKEGPWYHLYVGQIVGEIYSIADGNEKCQIICFLFCLALRKFQNDATKIRGPNRYEVGDNENMRTTMLMLNLMYKLYAIIHGRKQATYTSRKLASSQPGKGFWGWWRVFRLRLKECRPMSILGKSRALGFNRLGTLPFSLGFSWDQRQFGFRHFYHHWMN